MTATATTLGVWLDAVLAESRALLLEGPAGIGKSHLLRELVGSAGAQHQVLQAQPAEAETRLIGSALIDLCAGADDAEIAALPEMQAAALSAALLRENERRPPNPHAVALAFTTLVRRLAEQRPVLIAIDDIQWLDAQTAQVIAFAARRLPAAGVGLLLTLRTEPGGPLPDLVADLDAAVPLARWPVRPASPSESGTHRAQPARRERPGRRRPRGGDRGGRQSAVRDRDRREPCSAATGTRSTRCRCRSRWPN